MNLIGDASDASSLRASDDPLPTNLAHARHSHVGMRGTFSFEIMVLSREDSRKTRQMIRYDTLRKIM